MPAPRTTRRRTATRRNAARRGKPTPAPARILREAVLYARVSSKDQEREGFSIPAQEALLRTYAYEHDLVIVEEFVDVETAKRAGRTNFVRMLSYLEANPTCRILLVEKTDRLYRNLKDWVALDELEGLDIHLVKEGIVLSDGSRSSEKFIHGIKVLMAKNYIDNLSEETRKGMLQKARQGIWPSTAPLGYLNVQREDGKRVIAPDPEMAPLVAKLFEWYATGEYSLLSLAREAREEGLVSRKRRRPVPKATVHHMIQNPIYMGDFEWDGVRYEGIHEPLVSRELFQRVQDLLDERSRVSRRAHKREFAFSGLIACAACAEEGEHRLLIGSLIKKQYTYYHCERCKSLGRAKYHNESRIDQAVRASLASLVLDEEVMEWLKAALLGSMADEKAHHQAAIERLQAQYDKLQRRIDAAYEDRLDGRIDAAFFDRKAGEWRQEQGRVRSRMASHEAADQSYMEAGIALLELAQRALVLYESQEGVEKRRLLGFCYSNSLWDGETLQVEWKQPFDLLAQSPSGPPNETGPGDVSEARFDKWLPIFVGRGNNW